MLDQLFRPITLKMALGILFCAATLVGCSSSGSAIEAFQDKPKERKAPLSEYEATLNPVDFDKEINFAAAKTSENTITNPIQPQQPGQLPVLAHDSVTIQEEVVQGFRIQVHSSSNIDDANEIKTITQQKFAGDSIYVIYDAPVYKVRVGDFATRYEASQRLSQFIELGYRDAWVVPDRIIRRTAVPAQTAPKP